MKSRAMSSATFLPLLFLTSCSALYNIHYSNDSISLSPFFMNIGQNKFFGRGESEFNQYVDAYFRDPDTGRSSLELIESRGFRCERHWITTDDGYILIAYRMVNPFNKNKRPYPILMSNSQFLDVSQWLWNYGGSAIPPRDPASVHEGSVLNGNLAYSLANHGYDVWLFNPRGTSGSNNHTTLNTESADFWKFSYDEVAEFDLPNTIDYVRKKTHFQTIGYIGYSTTGLYPWQTMSTKLKYNDILKPVILIAGPPINANASHSSISASVRTVLTALPGPLLLKCKLVSDVLTVTCTPPLEPVCLFVLFTIVGFDSPNFNRTRLPVYLSSIPAGESTWQQAQSMQLYEHRPLEKFDYGRDENIRRYGTPSPPVYDLKKVTNRYIGLFYGKNDQVITYQSNLETPKELSVPLFENYLVPDDNWNHVDNVFGKSAGRLLYPKIIMTIQRALVGK